MHKRRKTEDMEPMDVTSDRVKPSPNKKRKTFTPKKTKSLAVSPAVKSYVNRAIARNEELKFFDTAINGTASSVSYLGVDLLKVAQGVTQQNRIGDIINVKRIQMKINFQPGDDWNRLRFLVATNPTTQPDSTTSLISSLRTTAPTENSVIWLDKWLTLHYGSTKGATNDQYPADQYLSVDKAVNWKIHYASGATANPLNRQLYLQLHSDSTILPNPGIQGYVRIWFTDA